MALEAGDAMRGVATGSLVHLVTLQSRANEKSKVDCDTGKPDGQEDYPSGIGGREEVKEGLEGGEGGEDRDEGRRGHGVKFRQNGKTIDSAICVYI